MLGSAPVIVEKDPRLIFVDACASRKYFTGHNDCSFTEPKSACEAPSVPRNARSLQLKGKKSKGMMNPEDEGGYHPPTQPSAAHKRWRMNCGTERDTVHLL